MLHNNLTQKHDKKQITGNEFKSCLTLFVTYKNVYWLNRFAGCAKRELSRLRDNLTAWTTKHSKAIKRLQAAMILLLVWLTWGVVYGILYTLNPIYVLAAGISTTTVTTYMFITS